MNLKETRIFKEIKKTTHNIYNRFISFPLFQRIKFEKIKENDFLPHNRYAIEWWYFTGFLNDRFGFEVTFFNVNLPPKIFKLSPPSINTCVSHFAITDTQEKRFIHDERVKPAVLIFEEKELLLRNGPWILESDGNIYHIYVVSRDISVDLFMERNSKMVLHGEDGIIKMGNAGYSYYYTFPSMKTEGYVKINGRLLRVNGETWHDHQWGNFKVEPTWDWFSLRLKNKTYLMAFNLWDAKKRNLVIQYASLVRDGSIKKFDRFKFEVLDRDFLLGKKRYPEVWKLALFEDTEFIIESMVKGQEVNSIITPDYYEGICKVRGKIEGEKMEGIAYIELTGYY